VAGMGRRPPLCLCLGGPGVHRSCAGKVGTGSLMIIIGKSEDKQSRELAK
jgi:hypothetical protein